MSTAETLPVEQWRIAFGTISPFESDTGTGNQNYSVNLDIGFNDSLLLSLFVSQADDPLNAPLTGFTTQPGNFWQSYGAAARWQVLNQKKWKLAISGSLEGWDVGSGGDDSFANAGDDASPNIFNDSGSRVFTRNIVGSLSLPMSWQASDHWQFSFNPGRKFSTCHTRCRSRWSRHVLWNKPLCGWRSSVPAIPRTWIDRQPYPTHRERHQQLRCRSAIFTRPDLFSRHQLGSQPAHRPPRINHQWLWNNTSHWITGAAIGQPLGLFRQLCVHARYSRHAPNSINAKATDFLPKEG